MAFYSLIKEAFSLQPAVRSKISEKYPNEGRKVLLFSDSRSRAAKLALEMSKASDYTLSRQLFALAVQEQEKCENKDAKNLDRLYGFCVKVLPKRRLKFLVEQVEKDIKRQSKLQFVTNRDKIRLGS